MQPADKRERTRSIAHKMYKVVTGYVNGQVLIAAIAASFVMIAILIGNAVFDASVNAVAMAGIAFVFGLIPMFGNILGAAIIVLVSLFSSGGLAIAMAIYFLVYQQIENATLQPYIQSRSNQLTPLTVFVAAIVGVGIGGVLGALAAIPVAGCIRILIQEFYDKKVPSLASVEAAKKD
jgi:predicted PurR-regulated permease PerM